MGWLPQENGLVPIDDPGRTREVKPMGRPPWHDWVPGVLSKQQVQALCSQEYLHGTTSGAIGQSSIDLHLSHEGWELTRGSVKPFGDRYRLKLQKSTLVRPLKPDDQERFTLEPKKT